MMMGPLNDGPLIPFRSSHLEIAGQRGPVLAQEFSDIEGTSDQDFSDVDPTSAQDFSDGIHMHGHSLTGAACSAVHGTELLQAQMRWSASRYEVTE